MLCTLGVTDVLRSGVSVLACYSMRQNEYNKHGAAAREKLA